MGGAHESPQRDYAKVWSDTRACENKTERPSNMGIKVKRSKFMDALVNEYDCWCCVCVCVCVSGEKCVEKKTKCGIFVGHALTLGAN